MLDSNVSTYIDKDGNVQEVGGGGLSFPISYTGTATDAKIDLITDYEGSREKYTTITPGVISLGNGMSSSKLEIASLDNGESTYIRFNPTGTLSAELFAKTDDTGSKAVLTVDGNPILASSNVDPEYANTSEIVDNVITLTSTSTLNDLVSQILANKTKVTRSSDMTNLNRILGAPKYTGVYGATFKVVNSQTISYAPEHCHYPDLVIECFGWGASHYYKQYIVNYLGWSSIYSGAPSLTGWVELSTDYNPYPVGSIYITTDPSISPPRVTYFGGTWEKIGTTGLPEVVWTHDIIKDIPYGQGVEMIRTLIPANTSAYIYGSTCSNVSEYNDIMSCAINVIKASDESPVDHYTSYARTTMGAGGGASISFYFPAVGYDCYAVLNTYGYRGETTSMTSNLQVVKIPQNQYVWKRIA